MIDTMRGYTVAVMWSMQLLFCVFCVFSVFSVRAQPLCVREACGDIVVNVPDVQRTYSSIYQNSAVGTGFARGMLDAVEGWKPNRNLQGNWMQIDLLTPQQVGGVVTQASTTTIDRVTKFKVHHSLTGVADSWLPVDNGREFLGNEISQPGDVRVTNTFVIPVVARFIRITPTAWYVGIRMRAGVVTCSGDIDECAVGIHNCAMGDACINTDGSFQCGEPLPLCSRKQFVTCMNMTYQLRDLDESGDVYCASSNYIIEQVQMCFEKAGCCNNLDFFNQLMLTQMSPGERTNAYKMATDINSLGEGCEKDIPVFTGCRDPHLRVH